MANRYLLFPFYGIFPNVNNCYFHFMESTQDVNNGYFHFMESSQDVGGDMWGWEGGGKLHLTEIPDHAHPGASVIVPCGLDSRVAAEQDRPWRRLDQQLRSSWSGRSKSRRWWRRSRMLSPSERAPGDGKRPWLGMWLWLGQWLWLWRRLWRVAAEASAQCRAHLWLCEHMI